MDINNSKAHQILQRANKISKGPLKFLKFEDFEWDIGHWPILRANHHFGQGLSLVLFT